MHRISQHPLTTKRIQIRCIEAANDIAANLITFSKLRVLLNLLFNFLKVRQEEVVILKIWDCRVLVWLKRLSLRLKKLKLLKFDSNDGRSLTLKKLKLTQVWLNDARLKFDSNDDGRSLTLKKLKLLKFDSTTLVSSLRSLKVTLKKLKLLKLDSNDGRWRYKEVEDPLKFQSYDHVKKSYLNTRKYRPFSHCRLRQYSDSGHRTQGKL
jgi:hypothetical protein